MWRCGGREKKNKSITTNRAQHRGRENKGSHRRAALIIHPRAALPLACLLGPASSCVTSTDEDPNLASLVLGGTGKIVYLRR